MQTTTKQAHTPGRWYVEKPYGEPGVYIAGALNTGLVAKIYEPDKNLFNADKLVTADANARLIAAAPDLLAACQAALDNWEPATAGDIQRQLEAAIAKATK